MEIEWIEALMEAGVDTVGTLNRFLGNSALYKKYLMKFPNDDTFEKIKPALEAKNWDTALAAAHTLKGLSGNLGFNSLFMACSNTVSLLRTGDYDEAIKSYEKLNYEYTAIISIICLI